MLEIIYDGLMLLHFVFYFRVQSWEVQASTVQYPIGHRTKQKVVKFNLFYFKNCSQQLTYEPELNLSLISEFCSAAFDLTMIDQSNRAEIIPLRANRVGEFIEIRHKKISPTQLSAVFQSPSLYRWPNWPLKTCPNSHHSQRGLEICHTNFTST